MKVLMTADCVGGVLAYTLDLARGLTALGHDVFVAGMGAPLAEDQRAQLDEAGVAGWDWRAYRLEWMAEPEQDLRDAAPWLLETADQQRPDVVHLNQFSAAALPWGCPVLVTAHSDVVTWWRSVHGHDPGPSWDAYRARVTAGLAAADLVVAPTAAMLDALRAAYAFDTACRVVPNGRGFTLPAREPKPQMVAVGRVWDEAKNIATAARAAEGLPWPLLVAGPGEAEGVRSLGRLAETEVAALLAESSIFVGPARYEPFGLAALEAAMAGCALVLGDIPSLREVWGTAATFVRPDDEMGLHDALSALIDSASLLHERQDAARKRAADYSVESMAREYADCYAALCGAQVQRGRVAL